MSAELLIGVVLGGIILIAFEVIVPGGILGLLGLAAMLFGVLKSFKLYGAEFGAFVSLLSVVTLLIVLYVQFKYLSRTPWGKQFFLNKSVEEKSTMEPITELAGKAGETVTKLVPTGIVAIEGAEYEAYSQSGFLEQGEPITVVGKDNFRILVERK